MPHGALAPCILGLLVACGTQSPQATYADPRPEGRLDLRERSLCEAPEAQPDWCDFPHEVRVFLQQRKGCDHFRSEPVPEPADDPQGERRRQIATAQRDLCTGTDATLSRLRARYRDDTAISAALAGFDADIE